MLRFFCALSVFILVFLTLSSASAQNFITTWKTDNPGTSNDDQITIPTSGTGYDYTVDWGDGFTDSNVTGTITHTYAVPGTYTVTISGTFPRIFFNGGGERRKLLTIEQWGNISWSSMNNAFRGCENMVINATDAPVLTNVTDMTGMFRGATSFNQNIDHWDVSTITNMSLMFNSASAFNQPLNSWDVGNVTNMASMFFGAEVFNQNLNNWNVGNVTNMSSMFRNAFAFNGDISTWDVSSVTTMFEMFVFTDFNQDIGSWNTINVTNMASMFSAATEFNQNIDGWNVGNVINMSEMFRNARNFNQPLDNWNVSSVTNMARMFEDADVFNQDLNSWDVGNVTSMISMFNNADVFNGAIGNWNTSSVTNMVSMFRNCDFNQPIGGWNVSNVTNMDRMFSFTSAFDQDISGWVVSNVTNMSGLFNWANAFNQDISGWDVSSVTNMSSMFSGAQAFNQDISTWNITAVTNMTDMFSVNPIFNQDLSAWDVSGVQFMSNMFWAASAFDQTLGAWDVRNVTGMNNMLSNSGMSTENYDNTLIGWASLPTLQNGITLGAQFLTYCVGETARNTIISTYGWTIDDAGLNCVAASFTVVSTSPPQNSTSALFNGTVEIEFSQTVNAATVNPSTIRVRGEQTGLISGTFTGGGSTTIIFTPTSNFKHGETIRVTVTQGVLSETAQALPSNYSFSFLVETGASLENPPYFERHVIANTSAATGPRFVFAHDLDSDGDLDILLNDEVGNELSWYENDGSQNFTKRTVASSLFILSSVSAADVDNDGDSDILVSHGNTIAWYENDGTQNFTPRIVSTTANISSEVIPIDLDGDGDLDFASTAELLDEVSWYENDGAQNFTERTLTHSLDVPSSIFAADLDGDGDIDLASCDFAGVGPTNKLVWFTNDGANNFTENIINSTMTQIHQVSGADMDNDGDIDLITCSPNFVDWFENDGSGNFIKRDIPTTITSPRDIQAGDIDGDGDLDLIVAGNNATNQTRALVYINDGFQNFSLVEYIPSSSNPQNIYLADVDRDSDLDILFCAASAGNKLLWFENTTTGCATPVSVSVGEDTEICTGSTISLNGIINNSTIQSWTTLGDGNFANPTSPTTSYTPGANDITSGTVQLTLTTQDPDDAGPCVAASATLTITIYEPATLDVGSDQHICPTDIVNLSATPGGTATNPLWNSSGTGVFGDNTSYTTTYTPDAGDISNGLITLSLSVDAEGVCPSVTNNLIITIASDPIAASIVESANVQQVLTTDVVASATVNANDNLTVTIITNGTKGNAMVQPNNTINYEPDLNTVGDDFYEYRICNQCGSCSDGVVSISIANEPPVVTLPVSSPVVQVAGSLSVPLFSFISDINGNIDLTSIRIVNGPLSNATATFDTNFNLILDYSNVRFAGLDEITIEVCDLVGACVQSILLIQVEGDIIIFNAVSANADMKNDKLVIENINFLEPENRITIYNRWGDVVWEGKNYDNATVVFTGINKNGKELPSGTYFYKLEFTSGRPSKTGYLSLRR